MSNLKILQNLAIFVVVLGLSACAKNEEPSTHVEEFLKYKITVPNAFQYRKDQNEHAIPTTVWRNVDGTEILIIEAYLVGFTKVNFTEERINELEDELLYGDAFSKDPRNICKTDTCISCDFYSKGHYVCHYHMGIRRIDNVYIKYTYSGFFPDDRIHEILNSISYWSPDYQAYYRYDGEEYSISYPESYVYHDTIENGVRVIKFHNPTPVYSNMTYAMYKGSEYNGVPIDSIISNPQYYIENTENTYWVIVRESEDNPALIDYKDAYKYVESYIGRKGLEYRYVYFVEDNDEFIVVKFGESQEEVLFKNSNLIDYIANSIKIH